MREPTPGNGTTTLPSYNPWPEEPSDYDGIAARLTDRENQSNQVRAGILGLIDDPALNQWLGASGDAFRQTLDPVPNLLAQMIYAYGTSADAVRSFAGQIRTGKDAFAKLQADLQAQAIKDPTKIDTPFTGLRIQLSTAAENATTSHDNAMKACDGVIQAAESDLRQVARALSDSRYANFNSTFVGNGGQLSDLGGLEYLGNDVKPSTVDPQKIIDAIAWLNQHLNDSTAGPMPGVPGLPLGGLEAYAKLSGMTPAEVDALLAMMTPQERQALDAAIGREGSNDNRVQWANLLLADSSQSTIALVQQDMPSVEPDWHTQYIGSGLHWEQQNGPLFGPNGVDIEHDLQQGDDGDCWFLSSAAAIAERDPNFFQSRIIQNPNGTYTVTFYNNGQPTHVTVDGRLPVYDNGNGTAYAHPTNTQWVAIYEKAFAQYKGGYGNIDGGWGDQGLHELTGQATQRIDPDDSSLGQISQMIHSGRAVTTGTRKDSGFLWWSGDGEYIDNGKLVSGHEYSVESVNMNSHPPTITLLNPWGVGAQNDHNQSIGKVTLTEGEWQTYCREIGVTTVRP
ncbi:hypothetical protein KGQ19_27980 [Catenulispora sp. NL8]|uniref:Calpain catalytic domain-containing protein n=1 Tax=Catenulispora pinistramenti TaxID=2705254 RepID=A0ABS5KXD5_9ACTN|nr:C2 family cysteine protease [Catenulispora pinistramenti]MBS2550717.1 hypothetical protein [Catenulispora pinistramenti]